VLKKLLNNTNYIIGDHGAYIAVGSPLCHDLIKVYKTTKKMSYALDTWRNGRESLIGKDELLEIWDKLQDLIDTGGMDDIMNGEDVIENPLPVFTAENGDLIETVTDAYGWPNSTKEGWVMYDNTFFKTKREALEHGIKEMNSWERSLIDAITEAQAKVQVISERLTFVQNKRDNLKSLYENENVQDVQSSEAAD